MNIKLWSLLSAVGLLGYDINTNAQLVPHSTTSSKALLSSQASDEYEIYEQQDNLLHERKTFLTALYNPKVQKDMGEYKRVLKMYRDNLGGDEGKFFYDIQDYSPQEKLDYLRMQMLNYLAIGGNDQYFQDMRAGYKRLENKIANSATFTEQETEKRKQAAQQPNYQQQR